jgi:hypothetical protein
MYEQWSWDQNPVNLTCIATAIPNATITWWVRDREINREVIDRNMEVKLVHIHIMIRCCAETFYISKRLVMTCQVGPRQMAFWK